MERADFPLILIGMYDYVEGATRLQKYGFLVAKRIKELEKLGFYNDWDAGDFGPFSKQLAIDLDRRVNEGLIKKFQVPNTYGFNVDRFTLTDGKETVDQFRQDHPSEYKKIFEITALYQKKSLPELLQDVYYQFPEYTRASKIKAEIGRQIYESDSYLSKKYDEPDI